MAKQIARYQVMNGLATPMTKRDVIELAKALKVARSHFDSETAWREHVNAIAAVCRRKSKAFDYSRFLSYCGCYD